MLDAVGVPSLSRTTISNSIRPERLSDNVMNDIQAALAVLSTTTIEDRVFSVYNRLEGQYMLFIPNSDSITTTTETLCFVLSYNRKRQVKAWHRFRGWNFRCGDRTNVDDVYFFGGTKMYFYGATDHPFFADFMRDPAVSSEGTAITFDWELPWNDFGSRSRFKSARYLQIGSKGNAQFDFEFYCDYQLLDVDGNDTPQITLPLVGGGTPNFGGGEQPYGGGRNTNDPRPYTFNIKFKLGKARIRGASTKQLRFYSITYFYHLGSMRA